MGQEPWNEVELKDRKKGSSGSVLELRSTHHRQRQPALPTSHLALRGLSSHLDLPLCPPVLGPGCSSFEPGACIWQLASDFQNSQRA